MYYESMIPFVNLLYVYGSYQRERRKWRWCGCFGHMTWTGDLCFASTALGATRMTPVTKDMKNVESSRELNKMLFEIL